MILIHGPPGCGKSSMVRCILKENDWNMHEINASEGQVNEVIKQINQLCHMGLGVRKRLAVVLEEIDGISNNEMTKLIDFVKVFKSKNHILIGICNERYNNKSMKKLAPYCNEIPFYRLKYNDLQSFVHLYLRKNKHFNMPNANTIQSCQGDIRQLINKMHTGNSNVEKQLSRSIFEQCQLIIDRRTDHRIRCDEFESNPYNITQFLHTNAFINTIDQTICPKHMINVKTCKLCQRRSLQLLEYYSKIFDDFSLYDEYKDPYLLTNKLVYDRNPILIRTNNNTRIAMPKEYTVKRKGKKMMEGNKELYTINKKKSFYL